MFQIENSSNNQFFFVDVSVSIRDFHLMKVSERDRNVNKKVRIGCFDEFLIWNTWRLVYWFIVSSADIAFVIKMCHWSLMSLHFSAVAWLDFAWRVPQESWTWLTWPGQRECASLVPKVSGCEKHSTSTSLCHHWVTWSMHCRHGSLTFHTATVDSPTCSRTAWVCIHCHEQKPFSKL